MSQVRWDDRSNGGNTDGGRGAGCRMEITTSTRRICRPPITSRARDVVVKQVLGLVNAKERNVGAIGDIEGVEPWREGSENEELNFKRKLTVTLLIDKIGPVAFVDELIEQGRTCAPTGDRPLGTREGGS